MTPRAACLRAGFDGAPGEAGPAVADGPRSRRGLDSWPGQRRPGRRSAFGVTGRAYAGAKTEDPGQTALRLDDGVSAEPVAASRPDAATRGGPQKAGGAVEFCQVGRISRTRLLRIFGQGPTMALDRSVYPSGELIPGVRLNSLGDRRNYKEA